MKAHIRSIFLCLCFNSLFFLFTIFAIPLLVIASIIEVLEQKFKVTNVEDFMFNKLIKSVKL